MKRLRQMSWGVPIIAALTLGLAPFTPMPHVVEKLGMLVAGELTVPLDIFDLCMHGAPWVLLVAKTIATIAGRVGAKSAAN